MSRTVLAAAVQLDALLGDVAHNLAACEERTDAAGAGTLLAAPPRCDAGAELVVSAAARPTLVSPPRAQQLKYLPAPSGGGTGCRQPYGSTPADANRAAERCA